MVKYFTDEDEFNNNMRIIKNILEEKGYVLESDHQYAYWMQYKEAVDDVVEWLMENNYDGTIKTSGSYEDIAVYGIYDSEKITYEEMQYKLLEEARKQMKDESGEVKK